MYNHKSSIYLARCVYRCKNTIFFTEYIIYISIYTTFFFTRKLIHVRHSVREKKRLLGAKS